MLAARSGQVERLLLEGALPQEIDAAITGFGFRMGPCAALLHGSRCERTEPDPCSGSCDADIFRASEVEHAVQHVGGDRHLGRLPPVRLEA